MAKKKKKNKTKQRRKLTKKIKNQSYGKSK